MGTLVTVSCVVSLVLVEGSHAAGGYDAVALMAEISANVESGHPFLKLLVKYIVANFPETISEDNY